MLNKLHIVVNKSEKSINFLLILSISWTWKSSSADDDS